MLIARSTGGDSIYIYIYINCILINYIPKSFTEESRRNKILNKSKTYSKIMTDVALHCMICYEEFDLKDHYPVVLPCGHTYVCVVCAKRLKKCMECREPLFWNPPQPKQPQHQPLSSHYNNHHLGRSPGHPRSYTGRVGRYSPGTNTLSAPQTPPHPSTVPEKKEEVPLPCPKNVVLLEMIEAKERQQRLLLEARQKEYEQRLHRQQERQLQKLQDELEEEQSERQQSDEDYYEETTQQQHRPTTEQ